jgi:hypothetical protein
MAVSPSAARWAAAGTLAAILLLAGMNLFLGELNHDEGWYLYAAKLVGRGELPYRDFAFTQPPVMPFVYALARPLVDAWGVGGGRLFTIVLGVASLLVGARLAAALAPAGWGGFAAVAALMLAGLNVYHSYFTTVVKTYALCALLFSAGFWALAAGAARARPWRLAAAGLLLALAAGVRLSVGAALPVVFVALLWRRSRGDALWFGAGAAAGLLAVFAPWLAMAREGFLFNIVEYHAGRQAGGLLAALVYKAGFVSRVVQACFLPCLLGLALAAAVRFGVAPRWRAPHEQRGVSGAAWASLAAVTLVHLAAPFPYDDYQVPLLPVLAAALASALARCLAALDAAAGGAVVGAARRRAAFAWALLFAGSAAAAFSSPLNQAWFVAGRDRIWWRMKEDRPLEQLARVARFAERYAEGSRVLLTQDTYLAVQAGMDVPRGMELGPFCYFPDLPRERAERLRVLNRETLREAVASSDARVAALSGYAFAIACPGVTEVPAAEQEELRRLVAQRFAVTGSVPAFGQGATTLQILVRSENPARPAP